MRILAGCVLLSAAICAQTITSSIVGSVVDPSNLPVAGVEVALRQPSTGLEIGRASCRERVYVLV